MSLALTRLEPIFRKAYQKAGFEDWQTRPVWGDKATRVLSKGFWNDARRINAQHAKAGTRGRWFPSMIDWLDTMPAGIIDQEGTLLDPIAVLADFLSLIRACSSLDFLLLTKRPENFFSQMLTVSLTGDREDGLSSSGAVKNFTHCMADDWRHNRVVPKNVWIGVSVEDEQRKPRIDLLRGIPAAVRFLSLEPLLEDLGELNLTGISWAIIGGESGPGARPCAVEWIRRIVNQCRTAGVPVFCKQIGANYHDEKERHLRTRHKVAIRHAPVRSHLALERQKRRQPRRMASRPPNPTVPRPTVR